MIERIPKSVVVAAAGLGVLALAFFAYSRPGYFANQSYVTGLLLFQLVIAAVWMYRRVFFPLILVGFLWAGVDLPFSSVWTSARWGVLGVGALVGTGGSMGGRPSLGRRGLGCCKERKPRREAIPTEASLVSPQSPAQAQHSNSVSRYSNR